MGSRMDPFLLQPVRKRIYRLVKNRSFFMKQQLSNFIRRKTFLYLVILLLLIAYLINYVEQVRKTQIILDALGSRKMGDYLLLNEDTTILHPAKGCQFKGRNLDALILITTLAASRTRRDTIRKTWANWKYDNNVMVFFFTGTPNTSDMEDIRAEAQLHGDLIIENLIENYASLSIKTLRMLKWFKMNCAQAKYLIKTDDDVFIHIPNMLAYLRTAVPDTSSTLYQNYIGGHVHEGRAPHTWNAFSKWYVPSVLWEDSGLSNFPNYVGGPCYVLSGAVVHNLMYAGLRVPIFNLEDIYLTGLIGTEFLDIELQHIPNMYDAHYPRLHRYFSSTNSITSCISYHTDSDTRLMYDLYDQILSSMKD